MESYATNCYIANKNIYFYCRLWKPRAPFKFRPEISWGRMKQLQPVIYLHLAQWPPPTPQSLFPYRVALTPTERGSRELIRRIEGRPGPHLRSVQHQHQPWETNRIASPRRAAPRALHSIWSVRWCKMHRFFVLLYTRTVQVNAGRDQ